MMPMQRLRIAAAAALAALEKQLLRAAKPN